jgi:hypothetical protein
LQKYNICIEQHIAEESLEGEIDARINVPNPRITIGQRRPGKVVEGSTTLVGITFRPRNFQELMLAFRSARRNGSEAFHYHPLTVRSLARQIYMDLINVDPLQISYAATEAGMPGKSAQRGFGFREITDLAPMLDDRPLSMSDVRPNPRFAARFSTPAVRKIDIRSLHVALTPEACNIHIDEVGFVLRGPNNQLILSPDFLQHMVNELIFKTNLRGVLGEWVTDHFSILVPSSDNHYAPTVGIGLELPKQNLSISASFSFGCRCLPAHRVTTDERIVPIPEGWSVGVGLTLKHDLWLK